MIYSLSGSAGMVSSETACSSDETSSPQTPRSNNEVKQSNSGISKVIERNLGF